MPSYFHWLLCNFEIEGNGSVQVFFLKLTSYTCNKYKVNLIVFVSTWNVYVKNGIVFCAKVLFIN